VLDVGSGRLSQLGLERINPCSSHARISIARGDRRCSSGQPPCSTETALGLSYPSRPAGAKPDLSLPTSSLHVESITQSAAQASLGTGDVLPAHQGDFLALAEGAQSTYWAALLEAVPLAPGFAPIQFIGEPLGPIFHRDQSI
jgi:hypothetical protein